MSDDICPFCNAKFIQHYIHYQRAINNKVHNESMIGYRCPVCNKLFIADYDVEGFNFEHTNIILDKSKYDEIPTLSYLNVNASYCFDCKRFTILKDDFNEIKDVVICKIIDETSDYQVDSENSFEIEQRQSVLCQYGYNVQTRRNLSEQQRHIILASIIESKIMDRRDVINHINTLIERGSKIESWKSATQKWKDDKQFVSEYQRDSLPEVIFNNIVLRYRKPSQK